MYLAWNFVVVNLDMSSIAAFFGCCTKNQVSAEFIEKVGEEELTQEEIQTLDSELHPHRVNQTKADRAAEDVNRVESFQRNLQLFHANHGEEALKIKYEKKFSIGEKARTPKDAAAKIGTKRGSVQYDDTAEYREMKELLDDPGAQKYLGKFVVNVHMQVSFLGYG